MAFHDAVLRTYVLQLSIVLIVCKSLVVLFAAPGPGNRKLCRKAPVWTSDRPMTRGQLLSKRDEFWDTAPAFNGRPEIWQALRAAAECEDSETAQAIMSAVDVT